MKHLDIRWNPDLQEWFCVKCGRTSDLVVRQDAQVEMELFECEIPTTERPGAPESAAFGATLLWHLDGGGHVVAGPSINGAKFFLAHESPRAAQPPRVLRLSGLSYSWMT